MIKKRLHNFRYALQGLRVAWREEPNFKIQVVVAVGVVIAGWILEISRTEWLIVLVMIGLVLTAEAFNTALEELCDKFHADPDPHIAKIKDLAAAAVLLSSITALVVGMIIFASHVISFFA